MHLSLNSRLYSYHHDEHVSYVFAKDDLSCVLIIILLLYGNLWAIIIVEIFYLKISRKRFNKIVFLFPIYVTIRYHVYNYMKSLIIIVLSKYFIVFNFYDDNCDNGRLFLLNNYYYIWLEIIHWILSRNAHRRFFGLYEKQLFLVT